MPEIKDKDDMLVRCLTNKESLNADRLPYDETLMGSGEGVNKVVETKGFTVKRNGDAIVMEDGVKLATEGDALVEVIHLNVPEPGVVVFEDAKEGEKTEVTLLESGVSEVVELNNGDNQNSAAVNVEGGVSYSDNNENLVEGNKCKVLLLDPMLLFL